MGQDGDGRRSRTSATEGEQQTRLTAEISASYVGNDRLLWGLILGVLAFWLFAQTTLNVAPDMQRDLGMDASVTNIAVSITALFSGIFIVFVGGLADRVGRVRVVMAGFV